MKRQRDAGMSEKDNPRPVAAAVIVDAAKVVLIRRRVREGTLSWQFPAGKVEPGESPSEGAAREAFEETGLVVEPVAVLGERVHPATGARMYYVACRLVSGSAAVSDPREVAEVAWCDRSGVDSRIPDGVFQPVADYLDVAFSP